MLQHLSVQVVDRRGVSAGMPSFGLVSYDVMVFAAEQLEGADLRALVAASPTLGVDDQGSAPGHLRVVRGARRRFSFAIDGPHRVEPEDVPEDVTARVLGPRYQYEVLVEGSSSTEVPHAVGFARRLARALDGAALDLQTEEVWSRSGGRTVTAPERQERISVVTLTWYTPAGQLADPAGVLVDAAQRYLPEALPRRFGEYEPLQGRYADVGADGFAAAWQASTGTLFTAGQRPVLGGSLGSGPGDRHRHAVWTMALNLLADPLHDVRWRDAVRRFFIAVADGLPALYANAQVTRGWIWTGRSVVSDSFLEELAVPLHPRKAPVRPSQAPTWWAWFGEQMRHDITGELSPGQTTHTTHGLMHEWTQAPANRDELAAINLEHLPARLPPMH